MSAESPARLAWRALLNLIKLALGIGLLIFVPAGTFAYRLGWVYLTLFLLGATLINGYLWIYDRALLARRLHAGIRAESRPRQKWVVLFLALTFFAALIVPALDWRLHHPPLPLTAIVTGLLLVMAGFRIVFLTFRANSFAASTVAVADDHRVIDSGPYALVRHPMYAGMLVVLAGTPLALGSWWGLAVLPFCFAALMWRLSDEEKILRGDLLGYEAYCRKVRSRLLPGVW